MAKRMTGADWVDWVNRNRIETEAKHPEWTRAQINTYLRGLADIFEGQGLICRPRGAQV